MDIRLDGETRIYYVVGDPIAQVKSPTGVTTAFQQRGPAGDAQAGAMDQVGAVGGHVVLLFAGGDPMSPYRGPEHRPDRF